MGILFTALSILAALLIMKLVFMIRGPEPAPEAQAPPEEKKPYTYADYVSDLHNKDMSISDILDKCGGVIPSPPPAAPEASKPPELSDAVKNKMAIFEQMSRGMAKPIVRPPVPVFVMKVWQVPCDQCSKPGGLMYADPREIEFRALTRRQCKKCGGTGALNIQDGRR